VAHFQSTKLGKHLHVWQGMDISNTALTIRST
jgi:hypothetical protein